MGEPLTPKLRRAPMNDSLLKKLDALVKEPDKGPTIEDFTIVKPISRGAFGKVFLGYKNTNSDQLYAIKVMRKLDMVNKNMVSQVITERNALLLSRSEFCVSLLYSLETTSYIYLVLEYMVGGDLKSLITMYGYFEEPFAKFYAAEVGCALEFLHAHGIVHRDIKPDNMLISRTGHVKLTDFGLSQLDDHCQAELAAMNRESKSSKYLDARTPGQVYSLTSQFFVASHEKRSIRCDVSNFRERMEQNPLNDSSESEHDDTKMSGVSPFFSADDISMSIKVSSDEFYTCNSSVGSRKGSSTEGSDENLIKKSFFNCKQQRFKEQREDSGVSSNNKTDDDDKSAKSEEYSEYMEKSEITGTPLQSFKRPMCSLKRRRDGQEGTGLTQEIDAMDLGTPKKQAKGDDGTPLKSVLKVRTLADNEVKNAHLGNVMASTPVSSQKKRDRCPLGRIKSTRFDIPKSTTELMSPIVRLPTQQQPSNPNSNERTPKNLHYVQKRTPKSVRRGVQPSDERILGTPDYLAPELLKMEGHGPEVDWWALGVCLYEFLTGVPPFNDETPERVFQNILNRNIEWPTDDEALSDEAMAAVEELLTISPAERPAAKEMQAMKFFEGVDWANITETEPPFVPTLSDPHDTGYFEPRNTMQHLKLSQFDVDI